MVEAMAALPPFVRMVKGRSATYPYFRTKVTGSVRLRGVPGTAEFFSHYAELLALRERLIGATSGSPEGTFAWLIDKYLKSAEYAALADATQISYARTCAVLTAELGPQPYRFTTRNMLKAVRDDYAATPRKAHKLKQMLSRLYTWADEESLVPAGHNPAAGFKRLKTKGGEQEIVPWSDYEIERVLGAAPAHLRTPLLLALYTGQRASDVVAMRWQQWQGDRLRVRQSKTTAMLELPCHPVLQAHLEALRRQAKVVGLAEICLRPNGQPFNVGTLAGQLRRLVEKLDTMPRNRSMHGLRYAAAARMESGGATVAMIEAVLGHRTFRMALKYASARMRADQGIAAMKSAARCQTPLGDVS